MRRNYIETYSFYKFLENVSQTCDGLWTTTLFYKKIETLDIFFACQLQKDMQNLCFVFFRKAKDVRINSTYYVEKLFDYNLDILELLNNYVLVEHIRTMQDFFIELRRQSEVFNDKMRIIDAMK